MQHLDYAKVKGKEIKQILQKIAFVFQNYNLFNNKNALEAEQLYALGPKDLREAVIIYNERTRKQAIMEQIEYYI